MDDLVLISQHWSMEHWCYLDDVAVTEQRSAALTPSQENQCDTQLELFENNS